MSKPTKEELTALLQTWKLSCEKDCEKECYLEFKEDDCEPCFKAIRSLIESLDKKPEVSKEVWNTWTARIMDDYNLGSMHIIYLIKALLTELGLEVEEEK